MAFSVTNIGTANNTTGTTVTITYGGGNVTGVVVILAASEQTATIGGSVTDTRGNSYSSIQSAFNSNNSANGFGNIFHADNAALNTSDVLTFTKSASDTVGITACYITGASTSSPLDTAVTNKATGTNSTPAVTGGTAAVSGELNIGVVTFKAGVASTGFVQASGWATPPNEVISGAGSTRYDADGGNKVNAGTAGIAYNPTITANPWACFIQAFKPIPNPFLGNAQPAPLPVIWYKSWEYNQTLSLAGPPYLQKDWPNPYPVNWYREQASSGLSLTTPLQKPNNFDWGTPEGPTWYRDWSQGVTKVATTAPFKQTDWPNPRSAAGIQPSWTWSYNLNLIGQDKLPIRSTEYPNPRPVYWYRDGSSSGLSLTARPFGQSDWPLPTQPFRLEQTWAAKYNPNLIGQDKLPIRNPSQVPDQIIWYREASFNLALTKSSPVGYSNTALPAPIAWYREGSQSLVLGISPPVGVSNTTLPSSVNWYNSWEQQGIRLAVGTPFKQTDWTSSTAITWYRDWSTNLLQSTLTPTAQKPFSQYDWPNPRRVNWYISTEENLVEFLPPPLNLLPKSFDWGTPEGIYWDCNYSQNLLETTLAFIPTKPFTQRQYSVAYPYWYRSWEIGQAGFFPSQPTNQQDWPNPQPVQWYRDWSRNFVITAPAPLGLKPNTFDWGNPEGDRAWFRDWSVNLLVTTLAPGQNPLKQTDWPIPSGNQWTAANYQVNNLIFTTPVVTLLGQACL